jgi:osmotically-inducible protein OsmY
VTVQATAGVVTLTGVVQDQNAKDLAVDTVENLPTVISVNNLITIEPTYPDHSDAWIAFKIHGLLLVKANVSAINTKVVVTDGNVILNGTADNLGQKELTEAYAKDIDGVKTVTNDIVVKAPVAGVLSNDPVDDASITSQVKLALLSYKSTSAVKTTITTTNGVVRVTGDANSDAEKALVGKLSLEVRGVKSVTNDMTVKS